MTGHRAGRIGAPASGATRVRAERTAVPVVGPADDAVEREADAAERQPADARVRRTRARPGGDPAGLPQAPASVPAAVSGLGRPVDAATRHRMRSRFGVDFSGVRLHDDTAADRATSDLGALAFTLGEDVVLGPRADQRVLLHELAHVTQQSPRVVRPYRDKSAFNFGVGDTKSLKEESFNVKTDKETKPWIQLVTVDFSSTTTDADGNVFWQGNATATYYGNPAAKADLTFPVAGGSSALGKTDAGSFTVQRIEGVGYNSGSHSDPFDPKDREGPNKRYSKPDSGGDRSANMHYAVFYNGGEALHAGPLDSSSHGCVHVDWSHLRTIRQVNYHSVIGLTKVKVSYPPPPAKKPPAAKKP